MGTPLVSIGIPTKNRAHLLRAALASLLGQTYPHIEYIVSDNASSDDTEAVVREAMCRDARIRYVRQSVSISGIENFSAVLRAARGAYFMWGSDDDSWEPRFVEALVGALETNPRYHAAMSHFYEQRVGDEKPLPTRFLTHDYTHTHWRELYQLGLMGKLTPALVYSMFRTDFIKKLYARPVPVMFNGLLLWLVELVLATPVYSVPEALHTRVQDVRPHALRAPDAPLSRAQKAPFAITHYVCMGPVRLLSSSVIPLHRKFLIFGPWLRRAWLYKRKILLEWMRFFRTIFH